MIRQYEIGKMREAAEIERLSSDLDAMEKKRNTASVSLMEALAENERLRAEKADLLKKRNAGEMQRMIDYWGKRAEKAEAEIERLRVDNEQLRGALSRIAQYQHAGSGMGQLAEIAQEALDGH